MAERSGLTANLESETECFPPDGVYATRVVLDDGHYASITNIGMRPTFNETAHSVEAHIFDFNRDIYGHRIKLELIERIRGEKKFASADELKTPDSAGPHARTRNPRQRVNICDH